MDDPPDSVGRRLARARRSLDGLSVGDALGESAYRVSATAGHAAGGFPPPGPWWWTDDTEQAVCLVEHLAATYPALGRIDCDDLAIRLARQYMLDPERGYGASVRRVLVDVYAGTPWADAASASFGGLGSRMTCPDTVPLYLWLAARHAGDYPAALAATYLAGGDVDTTCAIVGGIVAGSECRPLPADWVAARGRLRVNLPPPAHSTSPVDRRPRYTTE